MKIHTNVLASIAVSIALVLSACSAGDSHEKVADDTLKVMERMSTAMTSITDKATAEKAVADMKVIANDMKAISERAKKLGEPSADVKARIDASMKAKADELQKKMMAGMMKVATAGPEAMAVLQAGMKEIAPIMEEAGKTFK